MLIIGKHATAKIFINKLQDGAMQQIKTLCNQKIFKDSTIRIMPDVHSGAGCVIGFTADLKDKVIPNLVGVDIGCGVLTIVMAKGFNKFNLLDKVIRAHIPYGFGVRTSPYFNIDEALKEEIDKVCKDLLKEGTDRHLKSLGTLGGGNHFIEFNQGKDFDYITIHSGSRNFGWKIAQKYQNLASEVCKAKVPDNLKFLEGEQACNYIRDMKIAQTFAEANRGIIGSILIEALGIGCYVDYDFETVHNFISDNNIIRKGAVEALKGQELIIPINMRDGSILAVGKGNEDWNLSAPHGAGRLMSRKQAKKSILMSEFKASMEGIYSTCITEATLDEAPMAYKSINDITENIKDTVDIKEIIKPLYNFKAN